jgi:4-hydroxy-tetrahydrodipicolinate reductase
MVRVAVSGAAGRMGSRLVALSVEHEELKLTGAFEQKGHKDVGRDVGELSGAGTVGVRLAESVHDVMDEADVILDFTTTACTLENLEAASAAGKAMVVGTTGFTKEELVHIRGFANRIPCVMSYNMSLGVNLLFKVLGDMAGALGGDYDVEVVEAHHRLKKDAPSGTALRMAEVIAGALDRDLDTAAVYARKGMIGERRREEIGIQTVRAGDIVGEHTVIFGGLGERLEVTHRASSRDTFARGALRAAIWLQGRPAGLYDMMDVLGLKEGGQ